jgi:extradiol dioxygenase family protein
MKRFHVHVHVEDLAASTVFYSTLFGAEPTRIEGDYAKWMLDDPRINFAISTQGDKLGVDHLGLQTDDADELVAMKTRAEAADMTLSDVGETACCYARSDKYWLTDPQGVAWEQFRTLSNIPVFSERGTATAQQTSSCCVPKSDSNMPTDTPAKTAFSCC